MEDVGDAAHRRLDEALALRSPRQAAELEAERLRALRIAAVGGAAGLTVGAPVLLFAPFLPWGFLGLVAMGGATIHALYRQWAWRREVSGMLGPMVVRAAGDLRNAPGRTEGLGLARLRDLGLAQGWRSEETDDVFSGAHRGVGFIMAQVHLSVITRESGGVNKPTIRNRRTYFKGLFFDIDTPTEISCRILLQGPRKLLRTPWRRRIPAGMAPVAVPDPAFSRRFLCFSDNPSEALRVLTPRLAATLAELSRAAGPRGIDAGFVDRSFLLLLPRLRDSFAAGSLLRPTRRLPEEAHRMLDDALTPHRLIDRLLDG